MDPNKLPIPHADGDRETLRILLTGYQEIIDTGTAIAMTRMRSLVHHPRVDMVRMERCVRVSVESPAGR